MNIESSTPLGNGKVEIETAIRAAVYLSLRSIKGPYDLTMLSYVRSRLPMLSLSPPAVPLNIFQLSTRPIESDPALTFVGGSEPIPFDEKPWPVGRDGLPLTFLAQIDLRQSLEYEGDYEAIQIFGDRLNEFAYRLVNDTRAVETGPGLSTSRLYGQLPVKVPSYPSAFLTCNDDYELKLNDKQMIYDLPFFLTPLALCTGCAPYLGGEDVSSGRFLGFYIIACLPTIYSQGGKPYEYLDREVPIRNEEIEDLKFVLGSELDADSFGILYICQSHESQEIVLLRSQL